MGKNPVIQKESDELVTKFLKKNVSLGIWNEKFNKRYQLLKGERRSKSIFQNE
ncbi:hypothetical protein P4H71_03305 [Paenibacillus kribbensis]|uniref:hypothetical protein n=1 Tax=Paenibacillus kribbensis TaxID=172713 RepID=UPI002DBE1E43|nr:hypothetical protein [Paenibacillus kribbensis]MEC0233380.1 hypothetical protein [Paenibacillus kribbensis]